MCNILRYLPNYGPLHNLSNFNLNLFSFFTFECIARLDYYISQRISKIEQGITHLRAITKFFAQLQTIFQTAKRDKSRE